MDPAAWGLPPPTSSALAMCPHLNSSDFHYNKACLYTLVIFLYCWFFQVRWRHNDVIGNFFDRFVLKSFFITNSERMTKISTEMTKLKLLQKRSEHFFVTYSVCNNDLTRSVTSSFLLLFPADGATVECLKPIPLGYSWVDAGSKLVADRFEAKFHYAIWFEAGRRPASNQLRTS